MVRHSHSQWLNVLSELGLVGFVLFVVAIGGLVVAALGRLRQDRTDPERSLLAACQAAVVVFVVHMSIDWDWDMAAITVAFLLLTGVTAAYARDRAAATRRGIGPPLLIDLHRRRLPRLLASAALVLLALSWTLPYLSQRATQSAVDEASRGHVGQAAAAARRAHGLDPVAVDPLLALAAAQSQGGNVKGAAATLADAVRLQPDNYLPYYQMGLLQLDGFGDKAAAARWFAKALQLNPREPAVLYSMHGLTG